MAAISATWAKTMIAETAIAVTSASKAFNVAGLKTALMITASDWARDAMRRVPAYALRREALAGVVRIDHDVQLRLRYAVVAEELAIWTRDLAVATQLIRGKRVRGPATRSLAEPFWYANRSTLSLWFLRLRA